MVVVNRLGYGKTHDRPVLDFTAQAKIIEPFLGEKRTLLLGISYGGAISLPTTLSKLPCKTSTGRFKASNFISKGPI